MRSARNSVWAIAESALPLSSRIGRMTETSEVSFQIEMACPTSGGIETRRAWGMMICWSVCRRVRPTARAASFCPCGSACKPPRMYSAIYAPVKTASTTIVRTSRLPPITSSRMKRATNSQPSRGAPRTSSM